MFRHHLLFYVCILILYGSCDSVSDSIDDATTSAKEKVTEKLASQRKRLTERLFPPFDSDKADTENNKARFSDFINLEITPDISEIYGYENTMGINASYWFSFHCNAETVSKLKDEHQLTKDTIHLNFNPTFDFSWWPTNHVKSLIRYSWTDGQNYYKYFWYDPTVKMAYFVDFDI